MLAFMPTSFTFIHLMPTTGANPTLTDKDILLDLDEAQLELFYVIPAHHHNRWVSSKIKSTSTLPKLLVLHSAFMPHCRNQKCWSPRISFTDFMMSNNTKLERTECQLVLDWCLGASNADKTKNIASHPPYHSSYLKLPTLPPMGHMQITSHLWQSACCT